MNHYKLSKDADSCYAPNHTTTGIKHPLIHEPSSSNLKGLKIDELAKYLSTSTIIA
jgi:hypothetical protein